MKPKRYPYSGKKKQPHEEIAIKVNELKADVASVTSRTNQIFSQIVGDTKISVTNNSVELEAAKITVKGQLYFADKLLSKDDKDNQLTTSSQVATVLADNLFKNYKMIDLLQTKLHQVCQGYTSLAGKQKKPLRNQ